MELMIVPETISIPAGKSVRGGGPDDRFTNATELPRGEILMAHPFQMGRFTVTVREWHEFEPGRNLGVQENDPVTGVSWFDAVHYTQWLSQETGSSWRLPTEDEWEYACRAGTGTPFSTGHDISVAQANYLYAEDGSRVGVGRVQPVGSYEPNDFGLCDMHGNVSEWTLDEWRPSHEAEAPVDDSRRVVRGGGWDYLPRLLRSSWRDSLLPETKRDDLGFRVVVED